MNNNSSVDVQPSPFVTSATISNIEIRVMNVNLFTSVNVNVVLFDANKNYIDSKTYLLEGTDYTNWGNDDIYIQNYVLAKLGLTKA